MQSSSIRLSVKHRCSLTLSKNKTLVASQLFRPTKTFVRQYCSFSSGAKETYTALDVRKLSDRQKTVHSFDDFHQSEAAFRGKGDPRELAANGMFVKILFGIRHANKLHFLPNIIS